MSARAQRAAAAAADLALTGDRDAGIVVVDYDRRWPARFAAERDRLAPLLGSGAEIHHIGSTAVPDLPAKPIVDVMALVVDIDEPIDGLISRGGYQYPEAFNAQLAGRRWLCRPSAADRRYHLHLVEDRAVLARHLDFRDRLRASPALAREYAALKQQVAAQLSDDREGYSAAKSEFVARVEGS